MDDSVRKIQQDLLKQIAEGNFDAEAFSEKYSTFSVSPDYGKLVVNFVNKSDNPDPEYQTDGAAGFDFRANLDEPVVLGGYGSKPNATIEKGNVAIIPTGIFFELPDNMELQVRPRSGLAAKNSVTVLNSPGTIDSDYTGEIMIILINHGRDEFVINHGDRIAQGVIAAVTAKRIINLKKIDDISKDTERGDGKFGSTGTK